jgi:hypothetical protein
MLSIVFYTDMLSVIMLSIIMLNVLAPTLPLLYYCTHLKSHPLDLARFVAYRCNGKVTK